MQLLWQLLFLMNRYREVDLQMLDILTVAIRNPSHFIHTKHCFMDIWYDRAPFLLQTHNDSYLSLLYFTDVFLKPDATNSYLPTINDNPGANFFDRNAHLLHITLAGGSVVEIHEAAVVVITFNMPAVTPDEFFDGGQLVQNLAAFLDVGCTMSMHFFFMF